jgi:hypothetical protein
MSYISPPLIDGEGLMCERSQHAVRCIGIAGEAAFSCHRLQVTETFQHDRRENFSLPLFDIGKLTPVQHAPHQLGAQLGQQALHGVGLAGHSDLMTPYQMPELVQNDVIPVEGPGTRIVEHVVSTIGAKQEPGRAA